jgi:hypothetical protein
MRQRTHLRGSWAAAAVTGAVRATVAGLLRSSAMSDAHGGDSLATRSSSTTSS